VLWDYSEPGFGLRSQGKLAVFIVRYRQNGVRRHLTLGRQPEMSTAEARIKAKIILDAAKNERAPAAQWEIARSKSGASFFGEIAERYLSDFAKPRKKPSSVLSDRRNLELHILPALGQMRITQIERAHVVAMHASLHSTPTAANRCLALVSHIFTVATRWEMIDGDNPCRELDRFRERPRERYLTDDELRRLGHALQVAANGYGQINWRNYSVPTRFGRESPED
jgi:hypothetical protein